MSERDHLINTIIKKIKKVGDIELLYLLLAMLVTDDD